VAGNLQNRKNKCKLSTSFTGTDASFFFFSPILDVFLLPFLGLFESVLRSLNRFQETTAAGRIMKKTHSNDVKRDLLSSTTRANVLLVQSCSVLAQHVFFFKAAVAAFCSMQAPTECSCFRFT